MGKAAGFTDIEFYDANRGSHSPHEIPWYDTLSGKMSISGFRMTHIGRVCTHAMVWLLETLFIAPPAPRSLPSSMPLLSTSLMVARNLSLHLLSSLLAQRSKLAFMRFY